jgi:membrane protein
MAWAGRSLSKVMVSASCLAWRLPVTSKATARVIGAVVGLVAGIVLVSTIVNRIRQEFGVGAASLSFLAAFALYAVAWMALSMLLPRPTTDPGALLPGAVLVGAVLAVLQGVAQLYLPDKFGRASELYGAIGATVVTLGWFFFVGRAMVLGMSLDAVIYERLGSISQFVFGLPVVRVLPRKSAWIRKFFDLGHEDATGRRPDPEHGRVGP